MLFNIRTSIILIQGRFWAVWNLVRICSVRHEAWVGLRWRWRWFD